MQIYPENNSVIEWKPELLASYDGPVIPGTEVSSAVTEGARLQMQEITGEAYRLCYKTFFFSKESRLLTTADEKGLFSHTQLRSDLSCYFNGLGTVDMREEAFMFLRADRLQWTAGFEKDKPYAMLELRFSESMVDSLSGLYPRITAPVKRLPLLYSHRQAFCSPEMNDIVRKIIWCPFDAATAGFYLELKIREYLLVMLQQVFKKQLPRYRFTRTDVDRLAEAKAILLQDIARKPLSIPELARAVGINEFKLKAGFRQLFGTGVFECLHEHRMEKAKELLLNTDKPLKEICVLTGYPRITNFITAFRRTFGYTPGSLRRG